MNSSSKMINPINSLVTVVTPGQTRIKVTKTMIDRFLKSLIGGNNIIRYLLLALHFNYVYLNVLHSSLLDKGAFVRWMISRYSHYRAINYESTTHPWNRERTQSSSKFHGRRMSRACLYASATSSDFCFAFSGVCVRVRSLLKITRAGWNNENERCI